ncbi:uncharacterized protein LOC112588674 [Harpegnathos saltator]|uniref:uncharacterized protein LOC112588674 n=1 Tax=Harpegnathos saltator TaxID=610380 RepID=UPI000DBED59A|nr:uncharacterized protein LOC112588674 [Harpegnathos saltator]
MLKTPIHNALLISDKEIPNTSEHLNSQKTSDSPPVIQQPRNNSWSSRRRPVLHKASKSSASATFELLAEKKMELVGKQMEMEKIKTAYLQEKNQLEIDILKLQKEETQLKIDLLKKQLLKS